MFFFFLFFFPFGFTCIFKTSRGTATFRTSDTRGLYTKQHLTGADRAMMFPCKGLSERQSKNMRSSCTSAKETTRRGAFPPQESRSLSQAANTELILGLGVQTSSSSPNATYGGSRDNTVGPQSCPGLLNSSEVTRFLGNHFLFLPKGYISCVIHCGKHYLKYRPAHQGSTLIPDLFYLMKNSSL